MGIHEQTHYWWKVSMLNTHKIHIFFELRCCFFFPIQQHTGTIYICCLEFFCVFFWFFIDLLNLLICLELLHILFGIYCLIWICNLGGKLIPQQRYTTTYNDFKLLDNEFRAFHIEDSVVLKLIRVLEFWSPAEWHGVIRR